MARRKRKEDVPIWEPPEFDEVGYMRKEIENAKISVVVIAWAVVGAIIFYLLYITGLAIVGFLLGLLVFGALYFVLPLVGLPIHGFKRRDWASHAMVFFFSWLAFSIILLNAPFGDHTYPVIGSFQVGTFTPSGNADVPPVGNMTCYSAGPGSPVLLPASSNNTTYVIFRATDNVAVRSVHVSLSGSGNLTAIRIDGQANACKKAPNPTYYLDTYAVSFSFVKSSVLTVTAVDTSGLPASATIQIQSG